MNAPERTMNINSVPLPANSGHVLLIDSTRRLIQSTISAAAAQAPGTYRSAWKGGRVTGTISPTAQNLTITFEELTAPTGTTNAAFSTDASGPSSGTATIVAGTVYQFSWLPATSDWRVRLTAGATAPSAIDVSVVVTWDRTSGV